MIPKPLYTPIVDHTIGVKIYVYKTTHLFMAWKFLGEAGEHCSFFWICMMAAILYAVLYATVTSKPLLFLKLRKIFVVFKLNY